MAGADGLTGAGAWVGAAGGGVGGEAMFGAAGAGSSLEPLQAANTMKITPINKANVSSLLYTVPPSGSKGGLTVRGPIVGHW